MTHAAFSGKEIAGFLAPKGKMFVAVSGSRVIGTIASVEKKAEFWFGKGVFVYCCFAAVLPEYRGQGIYGKLMNLQEKVASSQGIDKLLFNTHPENSRVIQAAAKNGYKKVSFVFGSDSPWVYMVKWINGAPYSDFRLNVIYGCMKTFRTAGHGLKRLFRR